jgi:hypothetical protein
MIAGIDGFGPTRLTGLLSYAVSLGACVWRWRVVQRGGVRSGFRNGAGRGVYLLLALVQAALVLDMLFDIRWKLHAFFMGEAQAHNVYGERREPQLIVLLVLAGVWIAAAAWIARRFRGRPGIILATAGTMLSAALWFSEMLSYHYLDLVLYHMVGKLMLVSLVWGTFAAITCSGIWLDGRFRTPSFR